MTAYEKMLVFTAFFRFSDFIRAIRVGGKVGEIDE